MIYREWKYEDILKISELEKECFQDAWTYKMFVEAFSSKLFYGVCAEENGEIAGYACETVLFENAEVDNVAVAENYRRRGMGKTLLKKLERKRGNGARASCFWRCAFPTRPPCCYTSRKGFAAFIRGRAIIPTARTPSSCKSRSGSK